MSQRSRGWSFLAAVVFAALASLAAATVYVLGGDSDITLAGLVAMALGIVLTFAIGAGLMFLVFLSARRGHDEDVG